MNLDDLQLEVIDNVECYLLTTSTGDKIYFKTKLKGAEYRYLKSSLSGIVKYDLSQINREGVKENDVIKDMDMPAYFDLIIKAFPYVAFKVIKVSGETIAPSMMYYDSLDWEDADNVFEILNSLTKIKKN